MINFVFIHSLTRILMNIFNEISRAIKSNLREARVANSKRVDSVELLMKKYSLLRIRYKKPEIIKNKTTYPVRKFVVDKWGNVDEYIGMPKGKEMKYSLLN